MATAKKGTKTSRKSSAGKRAASSKAKSKAGKPAGPKKRASTAKRAGTAKRKGSGRRELIDTGTDKRYVRRRGDGTFKESDDVSRSLSADRRRKAKTRSKSGQGDRGDR